MSPSSFAVAFFRGSRLRLAATAVVGAVLGGSIVVAATAWGQTQAPAAPAVSKPSDALGPSEATLKKTLEARMGIPIESVVRLPVGNLYEVRAGDDLFYADGGGAYILIGNLIDVRTRENLTRTRLDALKEASLPPFKWTELPFDTAVKVVKGSGKRKVAIFEDPNCGYCKKLEKSILDIGDVTIYVFLYPVLGPDSLVKSKQVWCAPDRGKAWTDWMQASTALAGDGGCATPLDQTLALGKKLKVDGTPTLFFANNKRVEGAIDAATLEKQLAAPAS